MNRRSAVTAINRHGALLVFPINNQAEPASLWGHFFPKRKMRWEWDSGGDNRVAELWHLREELSRSREVVYAKWFRGRATFFSRKVFSQMVTILNSPALKQLGPQAQQILEILGENSPLSTKQIKKLTELTGRNLESVYQRAMKELWNSLLIVGFGEINDGAFPSLAVGTTQLMFEDLWADARRFDYQDAAQTVCNTLGEKNAFFTYLRRLKRS